LIDGLPIKNGWIFPSAAPISAPHVSSVAGLTPAARGLAGARHLQGRAAEADARGLRPGTLQRLAAAEARCRWGWGPWFFLKGTMGKIS